MWNKYIVCRFVVEICFILSLCAGHSSSYKTGFSAGLTVHCFQFGPGPIDLLTKEPHSPGLESDFYFLVWIPALWMILLLDVSGGFDRSITAVTGQTWISEPSLPQISSKVKGLAFFFKEWILSVTFCAKVLTQDDLVLTNDGVVVALVDVGARSMFLGWLSAATTPSLSVISVNGTDL